MTTLILFILVLGILVFVHEFGHFIVAKKTGMRVDEFAIGFPPRIVSKKIGETVYSINLIPLGGYVKIYGENPDDLEEDGVEKGFLDQPLLARFSVLTAGVLFNFLFAWLAFSIVFMFGFLAPQGYLGNTGDADTVITVVAPNNPAEEAGLRAGDSIVSVSAGELELENPTAQETFDFIGNNQDSELSFEILRGETVETIDVTPIEGVVPGKKAIGVSFDNLIEVTLPIHKAIAQGYNTSIDLTLAITVGMWDFFGSIFTGDSEVLSQVAGPVGIAGMVGQASELGVSYLITFTAIISLNLAVLNLIPFPALDGGQIVFVIWEAITKKKINPKIVSVLNITGFVLLMLLMIVVTFGDIARIF
jgi:regulator of sigma E protease